VTLPLIVMMLVAMFTVHLRYGFSAINTIGLTADGPQFGPPGYELNLLYVAGLLVLILGGAGPFSIDRLLERSKGEPAASPSCAACLTGSSGHSRPHTCSWKKGEDNGKLHWKSSLSQRRSRARV
jgi:hypothetical protein